MNPRRWIREKGGEAEGLDKGFGWRGCCPASGRKHFVNTKWETLRENAREKTREGRTGNGPSSRVAGTEPGKEGRSALPAPFLGPLACWELLPDVGQSFTALEIPRGDSEKVPHATSRGRNGALETLSPFTRAMRSCPPGPPGQIASPAVHTRLTADEGPGDPGAAAPWSGSSKAA